MLYHKGICAVVQGVDPPRRRGDLVHALPLEVGIVERRNNQARSRRHGSDEVMEVLRVPDTPARIIAAFVLCASRDMINLF